MEISLAESKALKGIALIMLLWHHLFSFNDGDFDNFRNLPQLTGLLCKLCVAVFVLLSGYGLTVKYYKKPFSVHEFLRRRFTKIFAGFWLIWLIFVPIGFFYGRTLESVYGTHVTAKFFIQLFGMQNVFRFYGLNATWWFVTCILLLYLIFPILNRLNNYGLALAMCLSFVILFLPTMFLWDERFYLISFITGIFMARFRHLSMPRGFNNPLTWICIFAGLIILRIYWWGLFDFASAFTLIMIFKSLPSTAAFISPVLVFLGEHSMNIFLFHTFVYVYYWNDYIYWTRNPFLIFITLLVVCLIMSMGINYLKNKIPLRKLFG